MHVLHGPLLSAPNFPLGQNAVFVSLRPPHCDPTPAAPGPLYSCFRCPSPVVVHVCACYPAQAVCRGQGRVTAAFYDPGPQAPSVHTGAGFKTHAHVSRLRPYPALLRDGSRLSLSRPVHFLTCGTCGIPNPKGLRGRGRQVWGEMPCQAISPTPRPHVPVAAGSKYASDGAL